jgi:spermidine/putrescine transport system ATP-binding protein
MSDRIAVMNAGKIEQLDGVEELYERPRTRFVAQFLGSCNLLEGQIKEMVDSAAIVETSIGDLRAEVGTAPRRLRSGEKITLAIRPEKIRLETAGGTVGNQVKATIRDIIYSGAESQYRLQVRDQMLNACALNSRVGSQGFNLGDTMLLHFPADALIVLND